MTREAERLLVPLEEGLGMYWVETKDGKSHGPVFYTKQGVAGEQIYVLDDEFGTFKELFFKGAVG